MKTIYVCLFFILNCSFFLSLNASEELDKGTLIVTYRTNEKGERLERVRFWLVDEIGRRSLYPKQKGYIDHSQDKTHLVMIENIPTGKYALEFLFPNRDGFFKEIPRRTVFITKSGVTKFDEQIEQEKKEIAYFPLNTNIERPSSTVIIPQTGQRFYSYPLPIQIIPRSFLLVESNLPSANWTIFERGRALASGNGEYSEVPLLPYVSYNIQAENKEGYELTVYPSENFSLAEKEVKTIELRYRRTYGRIGIETTMPSGETLHFTIQNSSLQRPIIQKATSVNQTVSWKSNFLPSGSYLVTVSAPNYYEQIEPIRIDVEEGQNTIIKLSLEGTRSIKVTSNNPNAIYLLKSKRDNEVFTGEGVEFTFDKLVPGTYTLNFKSKSKDNFKAPPTRQIIISHNKEDPSFFAEYLPTLEKVKPIVPKSLAQPVKDKNFKKNETEKVEEEHEAIDQHPTELLLSVPSGVAIIGEPFPDSLTNTKPAKKVYVKSFQIGKYPITNAQFATWLNEAIKKKEISYSEQGEHQGVIFSSDGKILGLTVSANSNSQIYASRLSTEEINFQPIPGKQLFPVIFVSWHGANAFAKFYGCRLPTENEWEKAAGMAISDESSPDKLIKFKYGFQRDLIDRTWANYKSSQHPLSVITVNTTTVGFYNGKNFLPLLNNDKSQLQTHDAISPVGAYDMSGNVWEFVGSKDANPNQVVAKGGCYDSLEQAVRVAENLMLPAEYCDQFTGFRIAKSSE